MPPELEAARREILRAALARAPADGWSERCLRAAAADAGFEPAMARRAFPRGLADLLDFFLAEADRRMIEELERRDLAAMRVRDRIATAVRIRLEQSAPHREAIRRATALLATPPYAPAALRALWRTVDRIWRAVGDGATDFNFYSKRMLLAGVYGATLLFWLTDDSPGFEASWRFLDRRIADVMAIQKLRGRIDARRAESAAAFARLCRRAARNG